MSELFNGTWEIDLASGRGRVWDPVSQEYIPDAVGQEIITIDVKDGVQHYTVLYGNDPVITMGYVTPYDSPDWAPYLVHAIEGVEDPGVEQRIEAFRDRVKSTSRFEVGKPIGLVRSVLVDDRTHYRVAKDAVTGAATYVMMRHMAEDGESYVSTVLNTASTILVERVFLRSQLPSVAGSA